MPCRPAMSTHPVISAAWTDPDSQGYESGLERAGYRLYALWTKLEDV